MWPRPHWPLREESVVSAAGSTGVAGVRPDGWSPRARPPWVSALNHVGGVLGPEVLVPLDEESLVAAAVQVAGLDDFGPDDSWREPFKLLVADINAEANLNLVGRILSRFELVRALTTLLRMADRERRHPEVLDSAVNEPVFITGMGRTGTTILHELMGQDPQLRAPRGYELRYPVPGLQGEDRRGRIADVAAEISLWEAVIPELMPIHEMADEGPDEDSVGEALGFVSQVWMATHRVPNFDLWMSMSGWPNAFAFLRRVLRHLQWQQPPKRWLLKGIYLAGLPHLFAEFPDARIVMTHRDPLSVLPSTVNLLATIRWQRTDRLDYQEIAAPVGMGVPFLFDIVVDWRERGVVPDDRFIDVRFADLMADHLAVSAGVYDWLGLTLTDSAADAMRAHLKAKPRARHGAPTYRFSDLGIDEAATRQAVARYVNRFDIPEEKM